MVFFFFMAGVCTMGLSFSRPHAVVIAIVFLMATHFIDKTIISKDVFSSGQGTHTH